MKIELVGTGAIYTKYNGACTLINEDTIVDMPNGTLKQLLKKNYTPEKIKTILIIGPKGIEDKIVQLFGAYNFENKKEIEQAMKIKYIELEQENTVIQNINGYKIQSILVSHGEERPAYGYVINDDIGLTGDSGICSGVEEIVRNSKITIADTSLFEGDSCHMGIDNIKYLVEKYEKQIITTHLRDTTREKLKNDKINNVLVVEDGYTFEI